MKLSKKAEYALRALLAMARAPSGTNFSIQDLARRERIPLKFLEQILLALRNGGLLRSKRGVGGGYQLQKTAAEISLLEVVRLMDGPFEPVTCSAPAGKRAVKCECGIPGGCGLGNAFATLRAQVDAWLAGTSLETVLAQEKKAETLNFEI
ncbi:MAG TPA: Rrf2 family transcriptional regulator [Prosthecobacter sp.]|nr:Rrf2 family transcriptional regulator [Prosthecobacter sp.]HRK16643.1 Rrf2 family transcriptional regulator [Prosthecobacter sp.]